MDFQTSTHRRNWIFTEEQLQERRASVHTSCVNATRQALQEAGDPSASTLEPLSLDEEAVLRRYYLSKIQEICRSPSLQYRARVQHCAQALFQRFYLQFSIMDHDPTRIFRTIIYFASKVEDTVADRLEEFCTKVKEQQDTVRRYEATIVEGVKYDLYVHTPYRALKGILQLLGDLCSDTAPKGPPTAIDGPLQALDAAGRLRLHERANRIIEEQMLSDLVLTCPPGRLALAAFRAACGQLGLPCEAFVRGVVEASGGGGEEAFASLSAALDRIDGALARESAAPVPSLDTLKALDLKLKRCRNPLLDPTSEIFKRKMKDKQTERNEKRDKKIAATREAHTNDLAAILGDLMPDIAAPTAVPAAAVRGAAVDGPGEAGGPPQVQHAGEKRKRPLGEPGPEDIDL